MLNVKRINEEKTLESQKLTERGLRKSGVPSIIEAIALTLDPRSYQDEASNIDKQIEKMEQQKREKKLLKYQLKNNPQTVSMFLSNKYSEGNFNIGLVDRYDNSEERKKSGITFDYHVYFPQKKDIPADNRGHNKYVLSDKITDRSTGDTYTYHLPIWVDMSGELPIFKTDYGENINTIGEQNPGLLWALRQLREAIDHGKFFVSPVAQEILTQWGFLDEGRIVHDVKRNVIVEKYLGSIKNGSQPFATKYLENMIKKENEEIAAEIAQLPAEVVEEEVAEEEVNLMMKSIQEAKAKNVPAQEEIAVEGLQQFLTPQHSTTTTTTTTEEKLPEIEIPAETPEETPEETQAAPDYTLKIDARSYPGMSVIEIAKANKITIVEYDQLFNKMDKPLQDRSAIFVPLNGELYRIRLRTGITGNAINHFQVYIIAYNSDLLKHVNEGRIGPVEIPPKVKNMLIGKGFGNLTEGKAPPDNVVGFTIPTRK